MINTVLTGFYCPNGTGYDWKGCEPGTYGASSGLRSAEDCFPCDPGKFCDKFNDTTFTGECDERFYCRNGSSSSQPTGEDGYYCFLSTYLLCSETEICLYNFWILNLVKLFYLL